MIEKAPSTMGDLVDLQRGTTYKSKLLGKPGPILLGLGTIARDGGFRGEKLKTYGGESTKKLILSPGDMYVSLKDVTQSGDLLGSVARVPKNVDQGRLTQDTVKLEFKTKELPQEYIYWLLRTPHYRQYCRAHATGTTNLGLPRDDFLSYPVPVLTDTRAAVIEILEATEGKIELNRQMNQTLEAMAQAIFKSWFVDFDPVKAKVAVKAAGKSPAEIERAAMAAICGKPDSELDNLPEPLSHSLAQTAALFPSSFRESEHGDIPEGWRITTVGDVAQRIAMGPFGSRITRNNFVEQGVPVIRGGNLKAGFVDADFVFLTDDKADELANSNAFPGDIIFTHRGTIGQVGQIPDNPRHNRYVVSQSQMLLRANKDIVSPAYLYQYFLSGIGMKVLLSNASQVGVPAIARPTTSLRAVPIVIPPKDLSDRFDDVTKPLFEQITSNSNQSRTLVALRDAMLPKLFNGTLQVTAEPTS